MKKPQDWRKLVKDLHNISLKNEITQNRISALTGIKQSAVSSFFACRNIPTLETYIRISQAVGVDIFLTERECNTFLLPEKKQIKTL